MDSKYKCGEPMNNEEMYKKKITKPEKKNLDDFIKCVMNVSGLKCNIRPTTYNQAIDDYEEYHNQEIRQLTEENKGIKNLVNKLANLKTFNGLRHQIAKLQKDIECFKDSDRDSDEKIIELTGKVNEFVQQNSELKQQISKLEEELRVVRIGHEQLHTLSIKQKTQLSKINMKNIKRILEIRNEETYGHWNLGDLAKAIVEEMKK